MIVADASVLANVLADDGAAGARARDTFTGQEVSVPDLADVEVASVLRRRWRGKTLTGRRFATALEDLAALPMDRYPALPFLPRAYELRSNVTPYDAMYVALAEQLACELLTADARLTRATGPRCRFRLLAD